MPLKSTITLGQAGLGSDKFFSAAKTFVDFVCSFLSIVHLDSRTGLSPARRHPRECTEDGGELLSKMPLHRLNSASHQRHIRSAALGQVRAAAATFGA